MQQGLSLESKSGSMWLMWPVVQHVCAFHVQDSVKYFSIVDIYQLWYSYRLNDSSQFQTQMLIYQTLPRTTYRIIYLSISSLGSPPLRSSPTARNNYEQFKHQDKLRVNMINFQSIKNKLPHLQMVIESTQPDVIIGTVLAE